MIPQELNVIQRLERGKSEKEVLASYSIGLSTVSDVKGWKNQLLSYLGSTENVKWHSCTVLYKKFIAVCCEGKPIFGPEVIGETASFYDEMYITDKCTFSEGSNKKIAVRT